MDVAKLVAVLCHGAQPLETMYGINQIQGGRLPLVQVPTTAGTGSEVTPISIVTTGETTKSGVVAPQLYADAAYLDAELTVGLPPAATAATGVDAMVHAIEAYTSKRLKNPLSDHLAVLALKLLGANLLTACRDGHDIQARSNMLLGAMLAGQAFANAPVGGVHALAYPVGGIFHVPHGLSNALVLPAVLRFNAQAAATLYAELGQAIGLPSTADAATGAAAFIAYLEDLISASQLPRGLRAVGIGEADLPALASAAMQQQRLLMNNPAHRRSPGTGHIPRGLLRQVAHVVRHGRAPDSPASGRRVRMARVDLRDAVQRFLRQRDLHAVDVLLELRQRGRADQVARHEGLLVDESQRQMRRRQAQPARQGHVLGGGGLGLRIAVAREALVARQARALGRAPSRYLPQSMPMASGE